LFEIRLQIYSTTDLDFPTYGANAELTMNYLSILCPLEMAGKMHGLAPLTVAVA
jgi:hypothetical protein